MNIIYFFYKNIHYKVDYEINIIFKKYYKKQIYCFNLL